MCIRFGHQLKFSKTNKLEGNWRSEFCLTNKISFIDNKRENSELMYLGIKQMQLVSEGEESMKVLEK